MKTTNLSGKSTVLLAVIFMLANSVYAEKTAIEKTQKVEKDDNRNPTGCLDTGYKFDMHTMKLLTKSSGASQSLYFIFNKSPQVVNLFQMRKEESSRSMFLNHAIGGNQWAVLATSETPMDYICTTPKAGTPYGNIIDCSRNLRICEYVNVKFGLNNKGNFWLVNSSSRNSAVMGVVRYGIIPDYKVKTKKVSEAKKKRGAKLSSTQPRDESAEQLTNQ